jgi:hypothetical protein
VLVFSSRNALRLVLKVYLHRPANPYIDSTFTMKRTPGPHDPKPVYLQRLERIARLLGSSVTAVYETDTTEPTPIHKLVIDHVLTHYSLEGSDPIYYARSLYTHRKFDLEAMRAYNGLAEGYTGGFPQLAYDEFQGRTTGHAQVLAAIPAENWEVCWNHVQIIAGGIVE